MAKKRIPHSAVSIIVSQKMEMMEKQQARKTGPFTPKASSQEETKENNVAEAS